MGQSESTETPQTPPHTEQDSIPISYNLSYISNELLKKNFTNIEGYSLNSTFENLSSIKNGKEVIEEEAFMVSIKNMFNSRAGYIYQLSFFLNLSNIWDFPTK